MTCWRSFGACAVALEPEAKTAVTLDAQAGAERRSEHGRVTLLANAFEGLDARFLADRLVARRAKVILYIARDAARMAQLEQLVRFFAPTIEILRLPAWDCLPYDRISPNAELMA